MNSQPCGYPYRTVATSPPEGPRLAIALALRVRCLVLGVLRVRWCMVPASCIAPDRSIWIQLNPAECLNSSKSQVWCLGIPPKKNKAPTSSTSSTRRTRPLFLEVQGTRRSSHHRSHSSGLKDPVDNEDPVVFRCSGRIKEQV